MDILPNVAKFLVGGSIIVGVTYLAHYVDPKYGGILAAAPITTTLAFIFTRAETAQATTQALVLSSLYFAVPSLIFLLALFLLLDRLPFVPSLGGAYAIWIGCVLVLNRILSAS
ncbi:MAG TPA: hypothetical protein VLU98_00630 [Methanomicrobiales archaeon]|nr:hypothetical protein [Methanomicrobiales archaeon]